MTDIATTSPYASKIKKPSPIKSSGIPKLAVSPTKPSNSKLPTSKPITRTVSASTHSLSRSTGQLGAPVQQSDDNPPNTPASPSTPSKSPNSARKSVGGTHRLYSPNATKERTSPGSSAIPSYAQPTFANSTRLPYAATANVSSIPAPRSILKKPMSPTGVSSKAAAVTQRLTSTQPLPPSAHGRAASSTAAKAAQAAGKHSKQSSLGLSSTNSRIPGYGSAAGSKAASTRASAQSSARTSRQGSVGTAAAVPASPELASILAQAQAAQAQVAEVQEEEAELHGRTPQRQTLGVHSRGHSRGGSVASNASNASNVSNVSNASANSPGSVLSPQSEQADDSLLLDEHDPLDDIDVDTSFDDVTAPPEQTEINSAPLTVEEGHEAEEQPTADGDDEFGATDDTFDDFMDSAADNNLIETPVKPVEHEEKTQDVLYSNAHSAAEATEQEVERTESDNKQTVIITAPTATAQERRQSNVHELSATPEPELEEKEDHAHKEPTKAAAQPAIETQVVTSTCDASSNTLALDGHNAVTINTGSSSNGMSVRKASLSQGSDAAPVTLDLVIGSTNEQADGQAEDEEYEDDEYEDDEDDEEGQSVPIVLSLNITIGSNGRIVQQSIQPATEAAPVQDSHEAAKIELITNEQAEVDRQQEEAQHSERATVRAANEQHSAAVVEEAQPAPQASQFTTIIIDRDTTGSYDNTASPLTRTPAPTITEQAKQQSEEAPMDPTMMPTRTPAPSTAVHANADSQPTSVVIESPAVAFPSTLTYFDTLTTTRDQPSVSTLEPAMRAPAPSSAQPATAAEAAAAVVKSVAFSDEVTALGESKEERSESLDFGDDFSLPTTPMRGSVMDPTVTNPAGLQPIINSQAQADSAASINRLKQLEAERRAEEDKRRADEVEAKQRVLESERVNERIAEAERAEQQAQAEDKVRSQLAESKRALFAQMKDGLPCVKLGKKGSPRDTRIFITEDEEGQEGSYTINWDSKSKKAEDARMPLADCRCVVGGEEGMFVHRKYAGKYDDAKDRCVSVVSAVRGLDVVLADEEAVNRLVAMLRLCGCPVRES